MTIKNEVETFGGNIGLALTLIRKRPSLPVGRGRTLIRRRLLSIVSICPLTKRSMYTDCPVNSGQLYHAPSHSLFNFRHCHHCHLHRLHLPI